MAPSFRLPHQFTSVDPAVRRELVDHHAPDGYPLSGVLWLPPERDPDVVVLAMHPRGDFTRHYLVPPLVGAGYAFMGAVTRHLNNDADALHERLLLDVAGAMAWLRARGFRRIVLCGNSGGGSLFAFYLQQSALPPERRLAHAPSGDRVPLATTDLPAADGFVLLAAHLGEGQFLLDRLDPSVIDEANPIGVNPRLDMYDPRNGYRPMEEGASHYAPGFVAEFRAGQRARCERIDRQALEWCEEAAYFRKRLGAEPGDLILRRHALQRRYLLIYRTLADPRYLDPTIDPSQRPLGSIFSFGRDPVLGNYGEGLARAMSARGWLSTWSGLSSNAELARTLPGIHVPTLAVCPLADTDIYPSECRQAYDWLGTSEKEWIEVPWADHYFRPVGVEGAKLGDPRERVALGSIVPWLRVRWPV